MKRILFSVSMIVALAAGACTAPSVPTEPAAETARPPATATTVPSPMPTSPLAPTASPAPRFRFDASGYDPDIYPPVEVEHQPQMIAQPAEMIPLTFGLVNNNILCDGDPCQVKPLLYYSYGNEADFESMPLSSEITRLPAADKVGRSLRYYAEFSFPEAGYTQRYPAVGTIDLFAPANFVFVELSAEKDVAPGDKVYTFPWGSGSNAIGIANEERVQVGLPAMDVDSAGRIALLDPANERVLIYDPGNETYSNIPLPFPSTGNGDLAFDPNDQLVVCDLQGQESDEFPRLIPYCYRLQPDGSNVSAPVYVDYPLGLTEDLGILDRYDYRLLFPFADGGEVNSREAQRQKQTRRLPYTLVKGADGFFDRNTARFADLEAGVAFEVHSYYFGVGILLGFEKTPQGYLIICSSEQGKIRGLWIDAAGRVHKDVNLPNGQFSGLSFEGQVAVDQDGSLYVMSAEENGLEIHVAEAPGVEEK